MSANGPSGSGHVEQVQISVRPSARSTPPSLQHPVPATVDRNSMDPSAPNGREEARMDVDPVEFMGGDDDTPVYDASANPTGHEPTQRSNNPAAPSQPKAPGPWHRVELDDGAEEMRREAVSGSARRYEQEESKWERYARACRSHPNKNFRWRPFADRREWKVAEFLIKSGMSQAKINEFLELQYVSDGFGGTASEDNSH